MEDTSQGMFNWKSYLTARNILIFAVGVALTYWWMNRKFKAISSGGNIARSGVAPGSTISVPRYVQKPTVINKPMYGMGDLDQASGFEDLGYLSELGTQRGNAPCGSCANTGAEDNASDFEIY